MNVSQLISKLKIAARLEPAPMGFANVGVKTPNPKPVLVARVTGDVKQVTALVKGADAVYIDVNQEEIAIKIIKQLQAVRGKGKLPYGCWMGNNPASKTDFSVCTLDVDMTVFKKTEGGKVLLVYSDIDDRYLRFLDEIPIDAILVTGNETQPCGLTLQNYILCQRLANVITRPLIYHVSANTGPKELSDMWDYGVDGVMIDAGADAIQNFARLIDGLELNKKRKKSGLTPVIPGVARSKLAASPEPEPDDDDYDDD